MKLRFAKRNVLFLCAILALLLLTGGIFLLLRDIDKTWDLAESWKIDSIVSYPIPDGNLKLSEEKQPALSQTTVNVPYCLLLNSKKHDGLITYQCSLLPLVYTKLQLMDPYLWRQNIGIQFTVSKDVFPTEYLGYIDKSYDALDAPSIPIPVSLQLVYSETTREATLGNKVYHWLQWRKRNPEFVARVVTSWAVKKLPAFEELSNQEKEVFINEWRKESFKEIQSLTGFSELEKSNLRGNALIDSFGEGFKLEQYVCSYDTNSSTCTPRVLNNPAESAVYYLYATWKRPFTQQVYSEMQSVIYPITPKRVTDGQTAEELNESFAHWVQMQAYQATVCPYVDIMAGNKPGYLEGIFTKLVPTKQIVTSEQLNSTYVAFIAEKENYSGLSYMNLVDQVNEVCHSPSESDKELLKNYYDKAAFRGIKVYAQNPDGEVVTVSNIAKSLYDSYMYSPYKYHLLEDGGEITIANYSGVGQDEMENKMHYSYNIQSSLIALYLLGGSLE